MRRSLFAAILLLSLLLSACGGHPTPEPRVSNETVPPVATVRKTRPVETKSTEAASEEEAEEKESPEDDRPEPDVSTAEVVSSGSGASTESSDNSVPAARDGYLYYVKVNTQANVVTVYSADDEGKYTVPVRAMICSTGSETPQNTTCSLYGGSRWYWLRLVHGEP